MLLSLLQIKEEEIHNTLQCIKFKEHFCARTRESTKALLHCHYENDKCIERTVRLKYNNNIFIYFTLRALKRHKDRINTTIICRDIYI